MKVLHKSIKIGYGKIELTPITNGFLVGRTGLFNLGLGVIDFDCYMMRGGDKNIGSDCFLSCLVGDTLLGEVALVSSKAESAPAICCWSTWIGVSSGAWSLYELIF